MLADIRIHEVHVIFPAGKSMLLSKGKSPVHQFWAARYLNDLDECLATCPEELASIDLLAGDLAGEADYNVSELTEGPELGGRTSICGDQQPWSSP